MANKSKIRTALRAVGEWFDTLLMLPREQLAKPFSGVAFGDVEEGRVSFTEAEADQYRHYLAGLVKAILNDDHVSARAIEMAYQRAILTVLDLKGRRTPDGRSRRQAALRELEAFLTGSLQRFRIVIPVLGLAKEGLPGEVGNVRFALFDLEQFELFERTATWPGMSPEQQRTQLEIINTWGPQREFAGRPVAIIEVEALDWAAAGARALREARLTLDVVNFFSALLPYTQAHLSLPGDSTTTRLLVAMLRAENGEWSAFNFDYQWLGSLSELSLPKLQDAEFESRLGFAYVSSLLKSGGNELQGRLLSALQWAGRAAVDPRREEAFLLYAIALEAFLLAENDHEGLTYRLQLRTAHLLGASSEERRSLFNKVKDLYGIRSEIVHKGDYQVTEADLSLVRSIAIRSLVRGCVDQEIKNMTHRRELARWFDDKLLAVRDAQET